MAQEDDHTERQYAQAATAFAAVTAFFASHLMPYADADKLAFWGFAFGASLAFIWLERGTDRTAWKVSSALCFFGSIIGLAWTAGMANRAYDETTQICAKLGADMVAGTAPDNGPQVFEALDCPPTVSLSRNRPILLRLP
ncbi:hypothetical protein [Croceicoccus marinus]|uniref:Uncharacterized protein n=1 Tax=Croceicoccus marinus TaxID=450378 RepID=A0A7G6VRT9_9SPHN|nr:hypothetical protein [Croceicoccus marinus]QNE04454.1 hypothetical protein H4O24_10760 [Croceicoccus marinus]